MSVQFRILGPLEALVDGRTVGLGGRGQRAVLAILLAQANETVPVERLIDGVWDDAPPETAGNVLQGYVSQLRKALGRETIATRGRGYAVVVAAGALDLRRFEQLAAAGAVASGRPGPPPAPPPSSRGARPVARSGSLGPRRACRRFRRSRRGSTSCG